MATTNRRAGFNKEGLHVAISDTPASGDGQEGNLRVDSTRSAFIGKVGSAWQRLFSFGPAETNTIATNAITPKKSNISISATGTLKTITATHFQAGDVIAVHAASGATVTVDETGNISLVGTAGVTISASGDTLVLWTPDGTNWRQLVPLADIS